MIKVFALLALSFFGRVAWCDPFPIRDPFAPKPFGQMEKQQELVDQTTNRGQTVEQERRGNARPEMNIENAIQEFNNQP
jgi:hypothetical protein